MDTGDLDDKTTNGRFFGRYWQFSNRPYPGCGCLWVLLLALVLYLAISLTCGSLPHGI